MGDFYITGMSDVTCPILINPEWSFQDQETLILSEHRTQAGKLFSYLWGNIAKYRVPLRFVNSSEQSKFNDWWKNQDEVAFTLNSSETESTVFCRLRNQTKPINKFIEPYNDMFEGTLQLEGLENVPKTRRPFILDDGISGLLDQDYNALIG